MKTTLIVVSDLHINSTVGLCLETFDLDDGGVYNASRSQQWLLDNWNAFWRYALEKAQGTKLVIVFNGDILDLNSHSQYQLVTQNRSSIIQHAFELLLPLVNLSNEVYFIRGTPSHTGGMAELEEILVARLYPESRSPRTFWDLQLDINGVLFQFAHKGTVGSMPWTRVVPLFKLATQLYLAASLRGLRPPNIAIRSHCHLTVDTYESAKVRVIQTPAFQLTTGYSSTMGFVEPPDIGGVIIQIDDDKTTTVETITYDIPNQEPFYIR